MADRVDVNGMDLAACLGWLAGDTGRIMLATLDSIAAAMPEGWDWTVCFGNDVNRNYSAEAWSRSMPSKFEFVEDCDTELLARARLAVACRMAGKGEGA